MQIELLLDLCSHLNRLHRKGDVQLMMHTRTVEYLGTDIYIDELFNSYLIYVLYKNYKKIYECHCKKIEKSF